MSIQCESKKILPWGYLNSDILRLRSTYSFDSCHSKAALTRPSFSKIRMSIFIYHRIRCPADGQAHQSQRAACPFPGRHRVHTYDDQHGADSECRIYFRSGCDSTSSLDVVDSCTLRPGLRRNCLKVFLARVECSQLTEN